MRFEIAPGVLYPPPVVCPTCGQEDDWTLIPETTVMKPDGEIWSAPTLVWACPACGYSDGQQPPKCPDCGGETFWRHPIDGEWLCTACVSLDPMAYRLSLRVTKMVARMTGTLWERPSPKSEIFRGRYR